MTEAVVEGGLRKVIARETRNQTLQNKIEHKVLSFEWAANWPVFVRSIQRLYEDVEINRVSRVRRIPNEKPEAGGGLRSHTTNTFLLNETREDPNMWPNTLT